ncbi:complement C1q tumor necrosis factor-related protein 3-like [Labeo rohita]|uniref:complement C1q tumor necrosis factor-related protein 3-like n=1 Tax=Labeo rohita TaxID=84645 RepID=UPI0021E301D2|nr:complement C1q tumor necrosis factor-related protein 3-like [Labeo rohita]
MLQLNVTLQALCCNCSSMFKGQQEEQKELTERSESLPVECDAATGNQQSCLKDLYPLLAEMNSTLKSLKASMDQEHFRRKEKHNIAFTAALGNREDVGPFNTDVPLVYKKVFLNAGSCYNAGTGIFTAPVKGVYFFSFSGHNKTSRAMALRLVKNGESLTVVYNHALTNAGGRFESLSNSITLMLEKGDQISMHLWANTWVFDNHDSLTLFTGHLVFPL